MNNQILVIGGGWSGLAVACQLAPYCEVTLLEAAPQLGGRARTVHWQDQRIDNGQHLFLGAYHHTYQLLKSIGLSVDTLFHRVPFQWQSNGATENIYFALSKKFKKLPWLSLEGINFFEKINFLRILNTFRKSLPALYYQDTVIQYLKKNRQSARLIQHFWGPLCEAALTTPIETAAITVFHQVMQKAFGFSIQDSDYWIPRCDLSAIFPDHAHRFLLKNGSQVHLHQRVQRLSIENSQCTGAWTKDTFYPADQIILATPYQQTLTLLQADAHCHTLCDSLKKLTPARISTLYLRFSQSVSMPLPFFYIQAPLPFWVFERRHCQQPDMLALVFSQSHPLLQNEKALIDMVMQWLHSILPDLPFCPVATQLICEKRGAFEATPHAELHRPSPQTPIANVLLAGDYVANGYPACLEGAVLNAHQCTELLKKHYLLS
jgi:squalene-associated FAD-dependent desaturase